LKMLAVLLAGIVSLSVTGFAHNGWDDGACDPIPVHHDHNAHHIEGGKLPPNAQDHCLFCHSLRSLGNGLAGTGVFAVDTAQAATVRGAVLVTAGRLLDSHASSRAPPVLL
jgi:hypothetical protein